MDSAIQLNFDVAVIGGGPAGISAAVTASGSGRTVGLIDDNPGLGGQIWRAEPDVSQSFGAAGWFARLRKSFVEVIPGARVFHAGRGILTAESDDAVFHIGYRKIILATGARELFLPFPGWTLPNVMGAGGIQALVKSGLPVDGKRVVVAGTGPLLFAVASYLRKRGAKVLCICEQASWRKLARFGLTMSLVPGKIRETLRFLYELRSIPQWTDCWPTAAIGSDRLEAVRLSHRGETREIECDYLACGFHLIPNVELAKLIGCRLREGFVEVDEFQRTSVSNVYCAGEPTGIGGVDLALIEGQIAGYAATNQEPSARPLFPRRQAYRKVVRSLKDAFRLRPELKIIAQPGTLLCRCEDVPLERVREFDSWRAAKLQSRCGMGPCQGRICGSAAEFLFGWDIECVRPPVFPVRCSSLAAITAAAKCEELSGGLE